MPLLATKGNSLPEGASAGADSFARVEGNRSRLEPAGWLLLGLVVAGICLRVAEFLSNKSLWLDEAALAINILDLSFQELLGPLTERQAAPPLFLWAEKAASLAVGTSEYALRLLPLACGILSIPLFCRLAGQYLNKWQTVAATGVFALSDSLVRYSCELKQYSGDVFFALLIYLFTNDFIREMTFRRSITLSAVGAIAVWASYPASFIVAAVAFTLAAMQLKQRQFVKVSLLPVCTWSAAIVALYVFQLSDLAPNRQLLELYGADAFFPGQIDQLPQWLGSASSQLAQAIGTCRDPLLITIVALLALAGAIRLAARRPWDALLFVLPGVLAVAASCAHLYPLIARMLLFLVPAGAILIAGVFPTGKHRSGILAGACLLTVVLIAFSGPYLKHKSYRPLEEFRPAFEHLMRNWRDGDKLYVYYAAKYAFQYYRKINDWRQSNVLIGANRRRDRSSYAQDVALLLGQPRVWVVFSHPFRTPENGEPENHYILGIFDRWGNLKTSQRFPGSHLYLYDMSVPDRDKQPGV